MLDIKFQIDKDSLARIVISTSRMPTEYADYLWDKYRSSYQQLQRDAFSNKIDNEILKELQSQAFFEKYYSEAKDNLKRVESAWKENKDKINKFLKDILRKEISLKMTAYICSPNMKMGKNIKNNCFVWGHMDGLDNENYDLVYMVHESLHSYFEWNNLTHAIIENITDVELAKYLNNSKSGYVYHDFTQDIHVRIYPFWNLYLNKPVEDIKEDMKITHIKYDVKKFERYRSALSTMNIDAFVEFLKNNVDNVKYDVMYKIKQKQVLILKFVSIFRIII